MDADGSVRGGARGGDPRRARNVPRDHRNEPFMTKPPQLLSITHAAEILDCSRPRVQVDRHRGSSVPPDALTPDRA